MNKKQHYQLTGPICSCCGQRTPGTLREALRTARITAGLTQNELGALLMPARTYGTIDHYELGQTSIPADAVIQWEMICDVPDGSLMRFFTPRGAQRSQP